MDVLVSIIITTYNDKDNLDRLLKRLKEQTIKGFEIIISDDGSNDFDIRWQNHSLPIKYVWQQDRGMRFCESINNAIRVARGRWIWFLSADLLPPENALELFLKRCSERVVLVGGRTCDGWDGEMNYDQVPDANLFFARKQAMKAGLWNEKMIGYGFEDYEMMCRMDAICGCRFFRLREAAAIHKDHEQKPASALNEGIYLATVKTYK